MERSTKWFQQRLAPRVDALDVALKALSAGEADAAPTIRRIAQSLREPAYDFGFPAIGTAAANVAESTDVDLTARPEELIRVLREEASRTERASSVVLIIGGSPELGESLTRKLQTADREVIVAATAAEAQHILREQEIVLVILNLVLPDLDGRTLLVRLRENPLTASIPVLVLAAKISEEMKEETLSTHTDAYMEQPVDEDEVASWVKTRLRRAHATVREARRDPLTGLLNRAAFRESFSEILKTCRASQEPICLALMSLDGFRNVINTYGQKRADEVLKGVGSLLSASLRVTDIIGRWGASEFAAIFPAEDQFGGSRAVEKVLEKLRAEPFELSSGEPLMVTMSAGVTVVPEGSSVDEGAAEADRYLYQAKSAGGNCAASNQSRIPRHAKRVLVLLHDQLAGRVVKHLLEREGFTVTHVDESARAMEEASGTQKFHLIVVDELMPHPGGFEVLEQLRRMPRHNRVPILMLLSHSSEQGMVRALELGANDYLTRPFSPFTFMTHMHRLLTRGTKREADASQLPQILIVGEQVNDLLVAATALRERGGFRVYLGKGGEDGLERFDEHHPDAVVVDFDMTEMTGAHFIKALLEKTDLKTTEVLLAASDKEKDDIQEFLGAGAKGVIDKPFEPLSLGAKIEKALGIVAESKRASDAPEHLNSEILRIMRMKD